MRKWTRRRLALPLLETRAAERLPSLWLLLLLMRLRLSERPPRLVSSEVRVKSIGLFVRTALWPCKYELAPVRCLLVSYGR